MVEIKIPDTLPNCELIKILADKANYRADIEFNFIGKLDDFCSRVRQEIGYINQLFPEYTPHDEKYHVKHLFHIAGIVLGRERMEEMNSAELFVLAISLYGHDWGMAVSDAEKQYILKNEVPEGLNESDLWILKDERERLESFAQINNIIDLLENSPNEISLELWREYVRETHTDRSGERIKRYFESVDYGVAVADAASRVCTGHWLEFEKLENNLIFPTDFSVLRETVNLRALAVYLRLIDLLDLGEDRTPYVIWKYVSPRNQYSKMEWQKHRSLHPITTPAYLEGRVIIVDGSTDDHEVFAALEDMRNYCDEQLRGSNDVLARMNDPRHQLDLYHINWRVAPRGFQPVLFRFEFDRDQMFNILSNDVYKGDPYVFLRELLQNSIDAIRMRREIHIRKNSEPGTLGLIQVHIEQRDAGDMVITWKDDGIGMDEYIVRNYLSVAGKSYYQSKEFIKENLDMDPISRFGIGILSCFIVSDYLEIETYKDPYLPPSSQPLRIKIPSIRQNFRVEVGAAEAATFGTVIRVFVNGNKINLEDDLHPDGLLDVTRYLKSIAGFVEFPIVIHEGNKKTVILHPMQDKENAQIRFGNEYLIHQYDLSYPWDIVVPPQDLSTAEEIIREKRHDISTIQHFEDCEGIFTFLVPINDNIDFYLLERSLQDRIPATRGDLGVLSSSFRSITKTYQLPSESKYLGDSPFYNGINAVFRDGVLLKNESFFLTSHILTNFPMANSLGMNRLVLNFPISKTPNIDISRSQLVKQPVSWTKTLVENYNYSLISSKIDELISLDPAERLYLLGQLSAYENLSPEFLMKYFPQDSIPIPFLGSQGKVIVKELKEISGENFYPNVAIVDEFEKLLFNFWIAQSDYQGPLIHWTGEDSVIIDSYSYHTDDYRKNVKTYVTDAILGLCSKIIHLSSIRSGIRFLESPIIDYPPLIQEIFVPINKQEIKIKKTGLLEKFISDPLSADLSERNYISRIPRIFEKFPNIVSFSHPFNSHFAYGWMYFNWNNQILLQLIRILVGIEFVEQQLSKIDGSLGSLEDSIDRIIHKGDKIIGRIGLDLNLLDFETLTKSVRTIWDRAECLKKYGVTEINDIELKFDDFIPGTIGNLLQNTQSCIITDSKLPLKYFDEIRPFGKVLE